MQNIDREVDEILSKIEENCNPSIGSAECNEFSLECLSLIRDKLPPIALQALDVLREYFGRRVPIEAVNDMRLKCWHHIDEHYRTVASSHAEVSSIRSVIFPLDAQRRAHEREIVDHLSCFLTFVNQVESHLDEEEALLRKHFTKCL
jgi:hypothetical protein